MRGCHTSCLRRQQRSIDVSTALTLAVAMAWLGVGLGLGLGLGLGSLRRARYTVPRCGSHSHTHFLTDLCQRGAGQLASFQQRRQVLLAPPHKGLDLGRALVGLGEEVTQLGDAGEARRRRACLGSGVRVGVGG